jgi:hypothetical protein
LVARQNRLARRIGLEEVEPRTGPAVGVHRIAQGVAAAQTGPAGDLVVVGTVQGVVVDHIVLEVAVRIVLEAVAVHTGLEAVVVDIVRERHSLVAEGELHTGPEAGRHTDLAAAHRIELAVVAGRSLVEAGSHRTVDFALVAVDDSLAVEVVDTVDADRSLGAAGLL